uniref:Neutrophil cytosolic factor 2 n=1 Tax=Paramormyrops kingsleyae TaxID=1676925 RepID=A0A3B3SAQ8_9TELE|nr:neutrophil cytosol factor 2 isoform X1 [Paramormyrops kingsleyae]
MSFVDTIRQWDRGVAHADKKAWAAALEVFLDIQEKNSKILFNIGCLYLINQELDAAEKAFDNSISKDEHLAVAFFQRGTMFYKKQKFEESLGDFQKAFKLLRGNQLIDYKLLGLRYKLYACEILHNVALTQAQLDQWEKAQESLLTALSLKTESKHELVDRALQSILKHKLFALVEMQPGILFRPRKHYVDELENKDYMGKAKVIASIIPQDEFSGFAPLQPRAEDVPVQPKMPEVIKALEGEPHSVLYEFIPETENELAVLPGNIVFVLQKDADNWASVIFNGKRGLVPYNFLEPVEITLSSKQGQGGAVSDVIPAPPIGVPPVRPQRREGSTDFSKDANAAMEGTKDEEIQFCVVKVHFRYTLAICVIPGAAYSVVLQKIGEKLKLPIQHVTLSYTEKDSGQRVTVNELEMKKVWKSVQNGRLVLWCDVSWTQQSQCTEQSVATADLKKVVALHSYAASQPEDLAFHRGDVITVLSKVNDEWFEGQYEDKVGIFPASFVENIGNNDPA